MCGLVTVYNPAGIHRQESRFERCLDLLASRGPDDRGWWFGDQIAIGFCRLSILDTTMRGHQPMLSADQQVVLAFNGQIYNYQQLRTELRAGGYRFLSESDTEVVLAAYLAWGTEMFQRLRGMWAIVIWDQRTQTLIASRDRLGIKPLFLYEGDELIFASEPKAILDLKRSSISVNTDMVYRYLMRGWMDDCPETFYSNIVQVEPGTYMTVRHGTKTTVRFWACLPARHDRLDIADLRTKLVETVTAHLQSDVPIGIALSGGVDSSSIACIVGSALEPAEVRTFTLVPPETVDERALVQSVLEQHKFTHHVMTCGEIDLGRTIQDVIRANDGPVFGSSALYQFELRRYMRQQGIKVLLIGEGGDEVFGGYARSFYAYATSLLAHRGLHETVAAFASSQQFLQLPMRASIARWLQFLVRRSLKVSQQEHEVGYAVLSNRVVKRFQTRLADEHDGSLPHVTRGRVFFEDLHRHVFTRYVPTVLRTEDRSGMAFGIETRVPFLDHELLEVAWSFPFEQFMAGGRNKALLRQAMVGIVPEKILQFPMKHVRPGNNARVVYHELLDEMRALLWSPRVQDRAMYQANPLVRFEQDRQRSDPHMALMWLRVFMMEKWFKYLERFEISVN